MNVNYIKHLEAVTQKMSEDNRLNATHVSMYLAMFVLWNHNRFQNPISINRAEVMKLSKIGSQGTYHKCMTDLHNWGYFKYSPSHDPLKGSLIYMFNFYTSTEQVLKQPVEQLVEQVPAQLPDTYINNTKHNKHINITNVCEDDSKIVQPTKKKKEIFISPSLEEKAIKLTKTEARTGSSNSRGTAIDLPNLEQVKEFFKSKNKTDFEAEKFFNHFESNGWLVGGKSKMKNWQASARNWILNSEKFQSPLKASIDRLHVNQEKDYSVPL